MRQESRSRRVESMSTAAQALVDAYLDRADTESDGDFISDGSIYLNASKDIVWSNGSSKSDGADSCLIISGIADLIVDMSSRGAKYYDMHTKASSKDVVIF